MTPHTPAPALAPAHAPAHIAASAPGRSCPLHYRYRTADMAAAPAERCDVLYVVGGLYGNEPALDTIVDQFDREPGRKRMVFNGDFHWFDIAPAAFERITRRVLSFGATRGNVETEAASGGASDDAGCGCGYPDWVGDDVVERSNRILARLRRTASAQPALQRRLGALPMWLRIDVGPMRVAVVHGDAESLAGWGFAQEMLKRPDHQATLRRWFEAAQVDAFACSHTCLPAFHRVGGMPPRGALPPLVLNNGAAGMPNMMGRHEGLFTRIATRPADPAHRRYGLQCAGVHVDAMAAPYDAARWHAEFLAQWPPGSDAHASYWRRITEGPDYGEAQATAGIAV